MPSYTVWVPIKCEMRIEFSSENEMDPKEIRKEIRVHLDPRKNKFLGMSETIRNVRDEIPDRPKINVIEIARQQDPQA